MRALMSFSIALLLLTGCQNARDFKRPDPNGLQLGDMTKQQIVAVYGQPRQQRTQVVGAPAAGTAAQPSKPAVSGTFTLYNYLYRNPGDVFLRGFQASEKVLVFEFFNDKLYAYNFVSDVDSDSSNFDESKVAALENGHSTRDEVESLFGAPTGRAIFPAAPPGNEKLTYQYVTNADMQISIKRLDMLFDEQDILQNFNLDSRSAPMQTPAATTVPIFIPTTR
ncbi:MAG TPA: hypothetical protein VGO34_05830 [Alphaproteobacteria bacterium]